MARPQSHGRGVTRNLALARNSIHAGFAKVPGRLTEFILGILVGAFVSMIYLTARFSRRYEMQGYRGSVPNFSRLRLLD